MRERNIAAEVDRARDRDWEELCRAQEESEEWENALEEVVNEVLAAYHGTLEDLLDGKVISRNGPSVREMLRGHPKIATEAERRLAAANAGTREDYPDTPTYDPLRGITLTLDGEES